MFFTPRFIFVTALILAFVALIGGATWLLGPIGQAGGDSPRSVSKQDWQDYRIWGKVSLWTGSASILLFVAQWAVQQ